MGFNFKMKLAEWQNYDRLQKSELYIVHYTFL